MKRVLKFRFAALPVKPVGRQELAIQMPKGSVVLSVGFQSVQVNRDGVMVSADALALWALCEAEEHAGRETRRFVLARTGEHLEEKVLSGTRFLGTAIGFMGANVVHVWEVFTAVPDGVA